MNKNWSDITILKLLSPNFKVSLHTPYLNESVEDVILNYDTWRTRTEIFSEADQKNLKLALRLFCKEKKTNYQQGMNEVLAPFMLLVNQGVPFEVTFASFKLFIDRIFPSIFTESVNLNLTGICKVVNLLIKYICPDIWNHFKDQCISTEFFMASWILTIFSAKIQDFEQVFLLWEHMLRVNNRFFIAVLCACLIQMHKEFIIQQGVGDLLVYLGSICLDSPQAIRELICKSQELLNVLPNSITLYLQAFDMCSSDSIPEKLSALDKFTTFQILPSEYLQFLYPGHFFKNSSKEISFVIIDVRPDSDHKNGYFPNTALFPIENLCESSTMQAFTDQFNGLQGFSHFVIMGEGDIESESMAFILVEFMINKGFCYVSTAKGGFIEAHKFTDSKGILVKKHNGDLCRACIYLKRGGRKISDFFWPGKKKVKSNVEVEEELDYSDFNSWGS